MPQEINIEINVKKEGAEKNLQKVGIGLKGIQDGAKAAGKSLFSLTNILKGTVIVKAFNQVLDILKDTFMSNQQVVDTLNTATTALKLVFNDFFNLIFGNTENMSKFGQELYRSLQEPFANALRSLEYFSKAMLEFFTLQFQKAITSAAIGLEYYNQSVGENNENIKLLTDSLSDYGKGVIETAKNIVQLNNEQQISIAQNNVIKEQKDREAEQLRQIRDEERNTIAERIKANNELGEVLEEQARLMLANNQIVINAAQAQFELTGKIEDQVALIEAQAEKQAILAQIEGFRSEQKANDLALDKERLELQETTLQGQIETQNILAKGQAELIDNEVNRLEKLKEIALQEQELTRQVLEDKKASYKEGTQAFIDASNELNRFNAESAVAQQKIDQEIADAKVAAVTGALGSLASLVGENNKYGKALAITQSIIDTYAGATKALKSGPPPFNFIAAASVVAAGFANVRKITSTKEPSPPSFAKGGAAGPATPAIAASTPPAFNVVGATAESQLAQTIAGAQQKPIRAYVVSTDVSSQQALDRKTANQAAIGN